MQLSNYSQLVQQQAAWIIEPWVTFSVEVMPSQYSLDQEIALTINNRIALGKCSNRNIQISNESVLAKDLQIMFQGMYKHLKEQLIESVPIKNPNWRV